MCAKEASISAQPPEPSPIATQVELGNAEGTWRLLLSAKWKDSTIYAGNNPVFWDHPYDCSQPETRTRRLRVDRRGMICITARSFNDRGPYVAIPEP